MSRYDAKSILQKVEAFAFSIQPDGGTQHEFVVDENVKNYALPGTYETFQTSILPQLGMHNAVNKISEGSRFPLLKKIYLKLFSPFLNRQAVFNAETLRAFDMMANHTDQMQQRMMEYHEAFKGVWIQLEQTRQEKEELLERDSEKTALIENLLEEFSELHQELILQSRTIETSSKQMKELESEFSHTIKQQLKSLDEIETKTKERTDSIQSELSCKLDELRTKQLHSIQHLRRSELKLKRLDSIIELNRKHSDQRAETAYEQTFRSITDLSNHVEYLVKKSDQSWVVESFKEMEKRIGKSEANQRDLYTRIEDAQRYRSMIEDALLEIERSREKGVESSDVDFSKLLRSSEKDLEYWRFQKQFRADDETLRKRHEKYLDVLSDIFSDANSVRSLDLACGDGVFLELQKEAGWKAQGVDINSIMVDRGNEHGLDIQQADALSYLGSVDKESFNLISAMQFVEHLTPDQLEKLLEDAHYALQSGGVLLIETINPHTLMAHKWFHFDLTHQKMIFPENMRLLAESKGFYQVRHAGINQVEDYARLVESEPLTDNWKKLNELLYGNQDYYLIAIKP